MRQRRLAKLAASGAASPSSEPSGSQQPSSSASTPPRADSPKPTAPGPAAAESSSRPIKITPASSGPSRSASAAASDAGNPFSQLGVKNKPQTEDGPPPKKNQTAATKEESLEDWSDRVLGDIFRVSLDESRTVDSRGSKLTYLPDLRSELEDDGEPIRFTSQTVDQAIFQATRFVPTNRPVMDYLLPCWKRVMRALKASRRPSPEQAEVLNEAKRLCMSNCIFALTMPQYFE